MIEEHKHCPTCGSVIQSEQARPRPASLFIHDVVGLCQSPIQKGALVEALMKASGCSKSAAYNRIPRAEKAGAISVSGKTCKTTGKFARRTTVQSHEDEAFT